MRFVFILAEKAKYPISFIFRILEVTISGFYAEQEQPKSVRSREDRCLRVSIRAVQQEHRRWYGVPRIRRDLQGQGIKVARKRIVRIMREDGLRGRRRRSFVRTSDSCRSMPVAANLLNRQFQIADKNRVWAEAITYLPTIEG